VAAHADAGNLCSFGASPAGESALQFKGTNMKAFRAWWRKLARACELVPLRFPGLILAGVGLAVSLRVGRKEADYLLYPAGLVAVGLVGVSVVCVTLAALALRRAVRRLPAGIPDGLETTRPARTGFRFPRLAAWPLVEATMRWEQPALVTVALEPSGRWLEETVIAAERGRHARVVRRFTVGDIFGLAALSFRVTWNEPLRIAPAAAASGAELATSYAHGDAFAHPAGRAEGDLVEMRRYAYGDPLRHVLWKTFARTRRLLVRMPERAIAPQPVTVAALVAGAGDEPTAATARLYLEKGMFGSDFLFLADGSERPTGRAVEAVEQIIDSVAARGDGGTALAALVSQVDATRLGACVVFAPPIDGPWRERLAAFSRRLPSPATVVMGVDAGPEVARRSRLGRLLFAPPAAGAPAASNRALGGLLALRAALEAQGVRVQILDRQTGKRL
jgi:uncharacterized protein DUF58